MCYFIGLISHSPLFLNSVCECLLVSYTSFFFLRSFFISQYSYFSLTFVMLFLWSRVSQSLLQLNYHFSHICFSLLCFFFFFFSKLLYLLIFCSTLNVPCYISDHIFLFRSYHLNALLLKFNSHSYLFIKCSVCFFFIFLFLKTIIIFFLLLFTFACRVFSLSFFSFVFFSDFIF